MTAIMVVTMEVSSEGWMKAYFAAVPKLLADYGGVSLAASREIARLEGKGEVPDRVAILTFPSLERIHAFMADPRYAPFRQARREATSSDIFIFENTVTGGILI